MIDNLRYEIVIHADSPEDVVNKLSRCLGINMDNYTDDIEELEDGWSCSVIDDSVEVVAYMIEEGM